MWMIFKIGSYFFFNIYGIQLSFAKYPLTYQSREVNKVKILLILHMKKHKKMKWFFKVTGQVNMSWVKNPVFQSLPPNSWCYFSLYYWYEQIFALENTVICLREGIRPQVLIVLSSNMILWLLRNLITIAQVGWGSFCRLVCKKA